MDIVWNTIHAVGRLLVLNIKLKLMCQQGILRSKTIGVPGHASNKATAWTVLWYQCIVFEDCRASFR